MATSGAIYNTVIKGKQIFDVSKSCIDNDIRMHAENNNWSNNEKKVLFKADERPIKSFFSHGVKDYHADKADMNRYKEIEVIFNNRSSYQNFLSRYYNRNSIQQKDLIGYLEHACEKSEISMTRTCLQAKTIHLTEDDGVTSYPTEKQIMEFKLTLTIN